MILSKKELEITEKMIKAKKAQTLKSSKGSDLDYIRDLQTLTQLESAIEGKKEEAI